MSFRLFVALSLSALVVRGGEIPLATSALGPAPGRKTVVAAVGTADGFLTVRTEGPYLTERLVAARISLDGEVLDPAGIVIGSLDRSIYRRTYELRAVPGGGYTLRVTTPFERGQTNVFDYQQKDITLDSDGRVVTSETVLVPRKPWPLNANGETLYVGTWPEYAKPTIFFVGRDGVHRHPTPLPSDVRVLSIVPDGEEWLILASDFQSRVRWYRIKESTRNAPKERTIATSTSSEDWKIVEAGGDFGVLLERTSATAPYVRNLTLLVIPREGGVVQYPLLTNVPVRERPFTATGTLAKDGDGWLVVYRWLDFDQQEHMRMWRAGKTFASSDVASGTGQFEPVLACGPARNLLLLQRPRPASRRGWSDVYAYVFDRQASVAPSHPSALLTSSLPLQTNPIAAAGPHGVLAAWLQDEGDLTVRFIGANGEMTAPAVLSSPAWNPQAPVVARNGDTYIVGWQEWRYNRYFEPDHQKLWVRRFDGHGVPLDAEPLLVHDLATAPNLAGLAIAAEGDGFRLAWNGRLPEGRFDPVAQTVFTAHVGVGGDEVSDLEALTQPSANTGSWSPLVLSSGSDSIVLFTELTANGPRRVMEKHYAGGVEVRHGSSAVARESTTVAAAAHGDEILLATVRSSDDRTFCTEARRLSFRGVELAPAVTLECSSAFPVGISVARNRNHWWVTSPASPGSVHELNADGTLAGTERIFPDGMTPQQIQFFATAGGPSAVYVRSDAETGFVERAFLRTLERRKARSMR